jgi:hypothetical protein
MQNMESGMNKLLNEIHEAQVRAGELVVMEHLASTGIFQEPALVAAPDRQDAVAWAVIVSNGNCRIWFSNAQSANKWALENNAVLTPLYTSPRVATVEAQYAEALAMDLQFDIDVASALAHAENAQDAASYQWVLPILVGGATADNRTALICSQLACGLDGDAAVDAAMKVDNEN